MRIRMSTVSFSSENVLRKILRRHVLLNEKTPSSRVFPIFVLNILIKLIQLESVNHDWKLLKAVLCFPLTVSSLV